MPGEARAVLRGVVRAKVVEQEERVVGAGRPEPDRAPQVDPCALDDGAARADLADRAVLHRAPSPEPAILPLPRTRRGRSYPVAPEPSIRPRPASLALLLALLCAPAPCRADDDPFGPPSRPAPPHKAPSRAEEPRPKEAPQDPVAALRPWIAHDDWLCRALAARELRRRFEEGTTAMLAGALGKETDPRVQAFLLEALAGRDREDLVVEGGVELVDATTSLLGHPHRVVRERARKAVRPVLPVGLAADADPRTVRAWWDAAREAYALERADAIARREEALAAMRRGRASHPDDTRTTAAAPLRRYGELERIQREGLEVMVCLDETGSMAPVIEEAKSTIARLLRRIRSLAPRFRVGLVTYDDGARVRVALTSDEEQVARAFQKVIAAGGGDVEEGVDKAIALAATQSKSGWSGKAVRVIVVVGDAPPHEGDVAGMLRFIAAARADPLYDLPLRIDTISTNLEDAYPDGIVPHFRAIAARGGGAAVRLGRGTDLALEIVASCFGPEWRDAVRDLTRDLDAFEAAAKESPKK
jgi:Mg-chelatase subunit ChlD